jgi:hypothetical protein
MMPKVRSDAHNLIKVCRSVRYGSASMIRDPRIDLEMPVQMFRFLLFSFWSPQKATPALAALICIGQEYAVNQIFAFPVMSAAFVGMERELTSWKRILGSAPRHICRQAFGPPQPAQAPQAWVLLTAVQPLGAGPGYSIHLQMEPLVT